MTTSSPRDWPWRSVARPGGQQRGCLVVELWSRAGGRQRGLLARRRGSLTLEAGCLAVEAWGDAGGRRRDLLAGRRAAGSAGAAVVVSRPLLWLWALQPTVTAGKKTDVVTGHGRGRSRTPIWAPHPAGGARGSVAAEKKTTSRRCVRGERVVGFDGPFAQGPKISHVQ